MLQGNADVINADLFSKTPEKILVQRINTVPGSWIVTRIIARPTLRFKTDYFQ